MIQARDIKVGAIFNRKHGQGWTETVIDEKLIAEIFSGVGICINDFEPIPLTQEWIASANFEKEMVMRRDVFHNQQLPHYQFKIESFAGHLFLQDHTNSFERVEFGGDKLGEQGWVAAISVAGTDICLRMCMVHYVHQLQDLYFCLNSVDLKFKQ